jgi:hypothetical protein
MVARATIARPHSDGIYVPPETAGVGRFALRRAARRG